jgi:hypothetical protein
LWGFEDLLFLLARDNLADAITERTYSERPMTEDNFIIIAAAIAVMGIIVVGVIGNAALWQEARVQPGS